MTTVLKRQKNYAQFLFNASWWNSGKEADIPPDIISAIKQATDISTRDWATCVMNLPIQEIQDHSMIKRLYAVRKEWDKMVYQVGNSTEQEIQWTLQDYRLQFHFFEEYCVVTYDRKSKIIIPWLGIVAFQDAIIGLFDSLIITLFNDHLCLSSIPN